MTQASTNQTFHIQTNQHRNDDVTDGNSVEFRNGTPPDFPTNAKRIWVDQLTEAFKYTVDGINIHTVLDDRNLSIFNVKMYGALGNGVANDRVAIQSAFTAATARGGGIIVFPYSSTPYMVDGTPIVMTSNTMVLGFGSTVKLLAGNYTTMTNFFTTSAILSGTYNPLTPVQENLYIKDIILDGNLANVTTSRSCTGLHMYQIKHFIADNVQIKNLPGSTGEGYGIITWYSDKAWITNCQVENTDRQNYAIWETTDGWIVNCIGVDSRFRDCILVSTNTPPTFHSAYCEIIGGHFSNTTASGTHVIRFSGDGSGIVTDALIEGSTTIDCVYVTDTISKSVQITDNKVRNGLYGVNVESDVDKFVLIDGNEIINGVNGINVNAAGGVIIVTNNKILNPTTRPVNIGFATIKIFGGNYVSGGNTQNSIRGEAAGTTLIYDNTFENNTSASSALLVGGDATATPLITNNNFKGNTVNEIRIITAGKAIGNTQINSTTVTTDYLNSRKVLYAAAAPVAGAWLQGDVVYNTLPAASGKIGFVCVTSGTPGTWKPWGAIDA